MIEVTHKKISYEIFSKVNDFFKKVVTKISDGGGSFQSTVWRLSGKTLFFGIRALDSGAKIRPFPPSSKFRPSNSHRFQQPPAQLGCTLRFRLPAHRFPPPAHRFPFMPQRPQVVTL
ncbi:MAG: hypothetical protein J5552_00820 [Prevotella sp.]|nr:hypothetical protein [Prevotella sp.]